MNFFSDTFTYIIIAASQIAILLIYFRVAEHYRIIDVPNHRSSHSEITIRGGGLIFIASFVIYALVYNNVNNFLVAGLLAIGIISFLDDITTLQIRYRLSVQLLAVSSLIYALSGFQIWPLIFIPLVYILIIGVINAFNFMDGINGITGLYSLICFASLLYLNNKYAFTDPNFIIIGILACLVFLFFNFRRKAVCFAGDVGSVSIAFWIISLIGFLIVDTFDLRYFLLLAVYGVDAMLTIIQRALLGMNILQAHRMHLYQLMANEHKIPHLRIAFGYTCIQVLVNILVIFSGFDTLTLYLITLVPLSIIYILVKRKLMV